MPQTCVVCGAKSHGIHFQVNACRACAAFFRRSVESGKKYKCRRASYNCDVSKDAFQQCRRCRFQKCKQVGMTMKGNRKVRLNDEEEKALEEEKQSSSVCSVDSNLTHVEEGHFENHRHKCDTHALKRKVLSVLDQNEPSTSFSNNLTLTLTDALHELYPMKAPESIVIGKAIDQLQMVKFYFEDLIITAKWMMRCEEYAKLPSIDKWLIYSKFWQYYKCLEKCARTTELLGNDNPNLLLLSHDVAMDLHDVQLNFPVDKDRNEKMKDAFNRIYKLMLNLFVLPMKSLEMTTFEVAYLCLYKMWSIQRIKGLSPSTYEIADEVLDKISTELHDYYVHKLKMVNYSLRLSKIIKLLTELEGFIRIRRNMEITADVFAVHSCDIRDSEFYGEEEHE